MVDQTAGEMGQIQIDGGRKTRKNMTQSRIWFSLGALVILFGIIVARLVILGLDPLSGAQNQAVAKNVAPPRVEIQDRHGTPIALDIHAPSLFAEPRAIIDVDEAVEMLSVHMPGLSRDWLRDRLDGDEGFVWLDREISPATRDKIFDLGIPGVDFLSESKRFYPAGAAVSHIVGAVNIDNEGIAGIERTLDRRAAAQAVENGEAAGSVSDVEAVQGPAVQQLSIDMAVQSALYAELKDALERYQAIAAAGVVLNVRTGEVLGMVSLPDYDPNSPATALEEGRFNRITAGSYELGSTFKAITFAAALDSGLVSLKDNFDARQGVRFGRFTIGDFHGKNRVLTVPEVFKYSSNIGTIRMMQAFGKERYREFLTRVGFDEPLPIELPETKRSNIAAEFSDIAAATASFGHGLAITPLHMATAIGGLVNDGYMVPATMFKRDEIAARTLGRQIVSSETSEKMRYLLRLNALEGSGTRMNRIAEGYMVGGKTGTAEKIVDGKYSSAKSLTLFASAFPLNDPQYAMLVLVDEPKRENPQTGRTAGWNAGELTGRIVKRIAPGLGIAPIDPEAADLALVPEILR